METDTLSLKATVTLLCFFISTGRPDMSHIKPLLERILCHEEITPAQEIIS
jgi:hypothetical protein